MNRYIQVAKWAVVPASIVIAQVALDANDAFRSDISRWAFIAASVIVLLVWRHRLGKLFSRLRQHELPDIQKANRSDRRFAFLSMSLPFALLFTLQLVILALIAADVTWAQRHAGTLWAVFGITAVGFWQITMAVSYSIVTHSSRWKRIFDLHPAHPPVQ